MSYPANLSTQEYLAACQTGEQSFAASLKKRLWDLAAARPVFIVGTADGERDLAIKLLREFWGEAREVPLCREWSPSKDPFDARVCNV